MDKCSTYLIEFQNFIKNNKWVKYVCIYSVLFLVFIFGTLNPFIREGKSLIWQSDGLGQYTMNLHFLYTKIYEYIGGILRGANVSIPTYSFQVGIGNDVVSMYFVGILEYIGLFFKRANLELTYDMISILRLYFVGISFSYLCIYKNNKMLPTLLGAYIYMFSGYFLYFGTRHPQFITPMLLLPLLIVALDKMYNGKNSILFVVLIFYSAWLDYYFLYMNTLILAVYYIINCVYDKKSFNWFFKKGLEIAAFYFLGICLAAVPFISKVSDFLLSARTLSTVSSGDLVFYDFSWFLKSFTRFFSPSVDSDYVKYYMTYAVPCITYISTLFILRDKSGKYNKLKIFFWVGIIFFSFPIFGFVFSGFSSIINRWSFAFMLLLSYMFVCAMPNFTDLDKKDIKIISVGIALFDFCAIIASVAYEDYFILVGMVLMSFTGIAYCLNYTLINKKDQLNRTLVLLGVIFVNVCINSDFLFSSDKGAFCDEFVNKDSLLSTVYDSLDSTAAEIEDPEFHRTELFSNVQHLAGLSKAIGYNGTAIYDSTNDNLIIDYFRSVENIGNLTVGNYYNYDGRAFLETLAAVKYYIILDDQKQYVPYGFEKVKDVDKKLRVDTIYKNTNYLPIAFTYDKCIDYKDYLNLEALQRQEAMLQGIVLEDANSLDLLNTKDLNITSEDLPYIISDGKVKVEGNSFIVEEDEATLEMTFNGRENSETYLNIEGLRITDASTNSMAITIKSNDNLIKDIWVMADDDFYKFGSNNYLVNLGYDEKGRSYCSLEFPKKGVYSFDNLKIQSQSMKNLTNYVDLLKKESLEDVEISNDMIKGRISLSKDKILCFSVPYSKGWQLFVDGEQVETFKGNEMYIAANINEGTHEIVLRYKSYSIIYGKYISLIAFIVFITYIGLKKKNIILIRKGENNG